jgi:uncharacterized phiE125 gp8 family phage protein
MKLSLVTDTVTEPITLDEMKLFLKVDTTDEDLLITSLISSARKAVEDYCNITMCTKVYDYYLDNFTDTIELPMPPCKTVDAFTCSNLSYVESTIPSTKYKTFIFNGLRRSEVIKYPATSYDYEIPPTNGIRIRFTAGYGATASTVPDALKTVVKLVVSHWFENRNSSDIPQIAKTIAKQFKVVRM